MSAPQTDPEKQARRHWAPLIGMALAALFGVLLISWWIGEEVAISDPPAPATEVTPPAPGGAPVEVIPPAGQQAPGQSPAAPPVPQTPPAAPAN